MNRDKIVCPSCYNVGMIKKGFNQKGRQRWKCKLCGIKTISPIADESELELLAENVKLAKQKQSAQDLNRIERKAFREHVRVENAVSKYAEELKKIFEKHNLSDLTIRKLALGALYSTSLIFFILGTYVIVAFVRQA